MAEQIDWIDVSESLGYKDEFHLWYDLYINHGYSIGTISRKLGFSTACVAVRIERLGIPKRGRGGPNNTAKIRSKLHLMDQRLIYKFLTIKDVCKLLKVNYTTVWQYKTFDKGKEKV